MLFSQAQIIFKYGSILLHVLCICMFTYMHVWMNRKSSIYSNINIELWVYWAFRLLQHYCNKKYSSIQSLQIATLYVWWYGNFKLYIKIIKNIDLQVYFTFPKGVLNFLRIQNSGRQEWQKSNRLWVMKAQLGL